MDDKLKYFLYAAQNLSFTKTAAHFFISTTAVSKAIANLEEKIGFPLFKRRYNSLELTQAGRNFYENARLLHSTMKMPLKADNICIKIHSLN
nr:LysR family transcriptional regulator [Liquorilactobacillus satsumensis]